MLWLARGKEARKEGKAEEGKEARKEARKEGKWKMRHAGGSCWDQHTRAKSERHPEHVEVGLHA